jgi:hypothetical protein
MISLLCAVTTWPGLQLDLAKNQLTCKKAITLYRKVDRRAVENNMLNAEKLWPPIDLFKLQYIYST